MTSTSSTSPPSGPAAVTLEQLLELLELAPRSGTTTQAPISHWTAHPQRQPADRVFGGLLLAQAVMAAGRTVPGEQRALSLQADFITGVPTEEPLRWRVERLSDAPSLSTRRATLVAPDGSERFTAVSRWGTVRTDLPVHRPAQPLPAPDPEDLHDLTQRFAHESRVPAWWRMERPVTFRHTEPPPYLEPVTPPRDHQSAWVRTTGQLPDDPLVHAAVLAYVTDMSILEGAFRALGSSRHADGSRILSLTHALTWHTHPDLSQWHQFDARVQAVAHGRTLGDGAIFARDGSHVASASQLGLVRLG